MRRVGGGSRVAACLLLLAWASPLGAAPAEKRAAVVDLVTEGVSPAARDRLDEALVNGLRFTGYEVMPRRAAREAAAKANLHDGCVFGPCLAQLGRELDVGRALVARVTADGQAYSFVLTLVETRAGTPVSQVAETCAPCSIEEVVNKVASSMVSLGEQTGGAGLKRVAFPEPRLRRASVAPWLVGVGAAALAAGVILATAVDPHDAGLVTIGAGSALVAGGIVVWALD